MISARTLNTIEDFLHNSFNERQIERLFEDNGIRRPLYMPSNTKRRLLQAYRETLNVFIGEETKLLFVAEALEKIYKADDIIAYPDGHVGLKKRNEILDSLKKDGYELVDGKLISIVTPTATLVIENAKTSLLKLYNDLKDNKNNKPETLIGVSKDLLESLFKTICDQQNINYDKNEFFDILRKKALDNMVLISADCTEKEKSEEYVRHMINIVSLKINELRNIHGHGHGKNENYKSIDRETALLISNLTISIATFFIPKISNGTDQ